MFDLLEVKSTKERQRERHIAIWRRIGVGVGVAVACIGAPSLVESDLASVSGVILILMGAFLVASNVSVKGE